MRAQPALLMAWRALRTRPRRTLILLLGYGLGVGVMIALLAVGDALVRQAQDRDVVAGGDVVLLPEGIDPEVLKVGGVTGMFLSIPNARFLVRQLLLGPRYAGAVAAVSPEIVDRTIYIRMPGVLGRGAVRPARAGAHIPSAARRAGSAGAVLDPAWRDRPEDTAWLGADPAAALADMDRFHAPPAGAGGRTWAEWWYFNFTTPEGLYGYFSFIADREARVVVSAAVGPPGGRTVRWRETHRATTLPMRSGAVPSQSAAIRAGPHSAELRGGRYTIAVGRPGFAARLEFRPVPHLYFPPVEWRAEGFLSGYVVPVLRAQVTGTLRLGGATFQVRGTGYHDHNWGIWQDVTWEWGAASAPGVAMLAGLIRHPRLDQDEMLVALYAVRGGRTGLLSLLRGTPPRLDRMRPGPVVRGRRLTVPGRLTYRAVNDAGDRLAVEVASQDVMATPGAGRAFLQIRGRYAVSGEVAGKPFALTTTGFAETFIPMGATSR